ncbi:hypothetical protein E2C01_073275 [Portunus trituberculatus]|uniref:Uncharacterized protein n=1 Tax=Portunus trituberculatus TaxID=210409 RepID=A0A5B7ICX1_PORTR|nr:hypothetical protein [Portunus trituberculatus]
MVPKGTLRQVQHHYCFTGSPHTYCKHIAFLTAGCYRRCCCRRSIPPGTPIKPTNAYCLVATLVKRTTYVPGNNNDQCEAALHIIHFAAYLARLSRCVYR